MRPDDLVEGIEDFDELGLEVDIIEGCFVIRVLILGPKSWLYVLDSHLNISIAEPFHPWVGSMCDKRTIVG